MARALTLSLLLLAATLGWAKPAPPPLTRPVNDFAEVIDARTEAELDRVIRALEAASGDAIVVATIRTFQPYADLPSYAVKMFENGGRGIGTRGQDTGALILLAVDDRQVRVEVGYGLEGFLTDGFAGELSRDVMTPFFRRGDYGGGLLAGTTGIAQRIAQGRGIALDLGQQPRRQPEQSVQLRVHPLVWLLLLYLLYRLVRSSSSGGPRTGARGGQRDRWSSGVGPFGPAGGWGTSAGWGRGGGGFDQDFGGGFGGGFGGFGGGRSGGGGGGASW